MNQHYPLKWVTFRSAGTLGIRWSRGVAKNVGNVDTIACLASPAGTETRIAALRGKSKRIEHEDYLVEDAQQALVMSNGGFVLANVAHPARYVMHALIDEAISKAEFSRATAVLAALLDGRPFDVERAYRAFAERSMKCEEDVWAAMRRAEARVPGLFGSLDF